FTAKHFKDKKRFLYLRNNASTLISQLVNAVLYNILAFYGTFEWKTLWMIIASTYVIFIFTSLADTPIVYMARKIAEQKKPLWYQQAQI
ncbi:MAG: queuosine precursor transporter, partial [Clostridia bacterium]